MSSESKAASGPQSNPFQKNLTELEVGDKTYRYYSLSKLNDERIRKLPYSIRILLESAGMFATYSGVLFESSCSVQ